MNETAEEAVSHELHDVMFTTPEMYRHGYGGCGEGGCGYHPIYDTINGVALLFLGVTGFFLSVYCMIVLIRDSRPHIAPKDVLLLSVAGGDAVLAIVATMRALIFFDPIFAGVDGDTPNTYCYIFAFLPETRKCEILMLLPLTIDRAVAVLFPLRYRNWLSWRCCLILVTVCWLPALANFLHYLVLYLVGVYKIEYYSYLKRCFLQSSFIHTTYTVGLLVCVVGPILIVTFSYLAIGLTLTRRSITAPRFLLTSTIIVLSGVGTTLPWVLLEAFGVRLERCIYVPLVVVLPFSNSVMDPLVYMVFNPRVKT